MFLHTELPCRVTDATRCSCTLDRIIEYVAFHLLAELIAYFKAILGIFLLLLQQSSEFLLLGLRELLILVLFAFSDLFHLNIIVISVVHLFGQAFLFSLEEILLSFKLLHEHVTELLLAELSVRLLLVEDYFPFLHVAGLPLYIDIGGVDVWRVVLRFTTSSQDGQGLGRACQAMCAVAI